MKKLLSFDKIEQINNEIQKMYAENNCTTQKQYEYCHRHILKKHKVSESLFRESSETFSANDNYFDY